ncbi:MAG: flippase-like domain-containing protein [Cytophagaceae bacterium]|nr:flippase-like domain-containing protein [Cytophagaceae bacterium]
MNSYSKIALKIILTGIILYFIYNRLKQSETVSFDLHGEVYFLFPALLCYMMSKFLSALRLWHLQNKKGVSLSFSYHIGLYLLGMSYNTILPGGVGGDAYKALQLKDQTSVPLKGLVTLLFIDRCIGLASLVFLFIVILMFILNSPLVYYSILPTLYGLYVIILHRLSYFDSKVEVFSITSQLLQLLSMAFVVLTVSGSTNFSYYWLSTMLSNTISMFPVSIGGLGIREAVMAFLSHHLPIQLEAGVLMGFIFFILHFTSALPGLWFHFIGLPKNTVYEFRTS